MAGLLPQVIQNLQGLQGLQANKTQMQDYEQQKTDMSDASNSLRNYYKTGNQEDLINATLKSPQLANQVLASAGLDDKRKQQQAASDLAEMWQLSSNPEAFKAKGLQRIDAIMQRGGNPTDTINLMMAYDKDPEQAKQIMRSVGAGLESAGYQTGIFAGQSEQMTPYQQASTDLRKQELEFNREQKALENKLKVLESQLKREDNDLKKQDLQLKIEESKADLEKKRTDLDAVKQTKEQGKLVVSDAFKEVNALLKDPNLDGVIGTVETMLPTVSGKSQDVINKANRLQSLLTADNLKMMSGVLTDKDIAFLTNIASGLNVTDGGIKGSVEGVRGRLNQISDRLKSAAKDKGIELEQDTVIEWGSLN